MNQYPKILIYSQTFNSFTGGGITLTNLFKGWPVENVAVISYPFMLKDVTTEVCDTYYQIGKDEYFWIFPLSLFKKTHNSGLISAGKDKSKTEIFNKKGIKKCISNSILNPFMLWLGLTHCISSIRISQELKEWLSEYDPDLLYLQISNRESINFARNLINHLRKPTVIHMMDDWPSTISSKGPFKIYWNKKIDREFKLLLDKIDMFLSISDAMSDEYQKRYHKTFKAFHNPVDIVEYSDRIPKISSNKLIHRVLYIGRIGTANKNSISFFAGFVSQLSSSAFVLEFHIFTKDIDDPDVTNLGSLKNVFLKPAVNHEKVYSLLQQYDVLLLPLDFTEMGLRFARFSIPTKASEYMFSGTPILVFAPEETAVVHFFQANDCGCCVTELSRLKLEESFENILSNNDYRFRLVRNATNIARDRFDGENVRSEFHHLLKKTVVKYNANFKRNAK
jgi:glycosyltransferase involved in cell wall biosynthesis